MTTLMTILGLTAGTAVTGVLAVMAVRSLKKDRVAMKGLPGEFERIHAERSR